MINPDECMSCGACLDNICPNEAIYLDGSKVAIDLKKCQQCDVCDGVCPAEEL